MSLHQENNYPEPEPPSDLDVNLADGTGDEEYLELLDKALAEAFRRFAPEMIFYIGGADPYREDQLGGLWPSMRGLQERETLVFAEARLRRPARCGGVCWRRRAQSRRYCSHSREYDHRSARCCRGASEQGESVT